MILQQEVFCYRDQRAELDALEAEKLFTQSRAKALQNKIIDAQVEEHLLKMVGTRYFVK